MALLEIENIHKNFGKTEVLKGISFSLEKGEVLSVLGSSGGGKTTLLRCINFLETPDVGRMKINGETIFDAGSEEKMTEKQIRQNRLHFGLVFQSFNLFPQYTVLENLMLAKELIEKSKKKDGMTKEQIKEQAYELLKNVGLTEKADSYPCELSGGQQQRVAIARALSLNPEVLCFDEPTSALDPELTGEVLRVIKELKSADRTMIIVTHELGFARNVSDRIMFIADGRIEEEGTPDEVFDNPKSAKMRAFLNKSLERL
ncbi:MAG: amino acid ABC transporter ATP-binding protein [Clostridiales bacterium]|nr:amino acid ABC transporter ATP-binding protein [Clostridiales bacterium]